MILLVAAINWKLGGLTSLSLSYLSDGWGRGLAAGAVLDLKRPLVGISLLSYRERSDFFNQMDLTLTYRSSPKGGVIYAFGGHYILSDYPFSNNTLVLFGGFGDYSYFSSFEAGAAYSMYGGDLSYGVLQVSVSAGRFVSSKVWLEAFAILSQVSDTSEFHLSSPVFPSFGATFRFLTGRFKPYVGAWLGRQFLAVKWYGLIVSNYPFVYEGGALLGLLVDVGNLRPGIHLTYDRLWDPTYRQASSRIGLSFSVSPAPSL